MGLTPCSFSGLAAWLLTFWLCQIVIFCTLASCLYWRELLPCSKAWSCLALSLMVGVGSFWLCPWIEDSFGSHLHFSCHIAFLGGPSRGDGTLLVLWSETGTSGWIFSTHFPFFSFDDGTEIGCSFFWAFLWPSCRCSSSFKVLWPVGFCFRAFGSHICAWPS